MKYALDTEFIDTPTCSQLISLALVSERGGYIYFEFDYPESEMTPWLNEHVKLFLAGSKISFQAAAEEIVKFTDGTDPEIWCYYGAYDWYWFCRLFGGMMSVPHWIGHSYREFNLYQRGVPNLHGPGHNALNDARSLMDSMYLHRDLGLKR